MTITTMAMKIMKKMIAATIVCMESRFYERFLVKTDRMIYQAMMAAKPLMPSHKSKGMHERIKMYLISLPFQPQCLNFRANMGISAMSR